MENKLKGKNKINWKISIFISPFIGMVFYKKINKW